MKKALAIILFIFWGICLTVILTFATEIGSGISKFLRMFVDSQTNDVKIIDVEVDLKETYVFENNYSLNYRVIGEYDTDPGLIFTSMDIGSLVVNSSTGSFMAKKQLSSEKAVGRIKITSKYDLHFSKIISINFEKKYPENFRLNAFFKSDGTDVKIGYVDIPIYVYFTILSTNKYSENDFEIIYDSEYLQLLEKKSSGADFIPIKNTAEDEMTTVSIKLGNGHTKSYSFPIKENPNVQYFDTISTVSGKYTELNDEYVLKVGQYLHLFPCIDGESVKTDFSVEIEDTSIIALYNPLLGTIRALKPGIAKITVSLPNGFSKVISFKCESTIFPPVITGFSYNEDGIIIMKEMLKHTYEYSFPSQSTLKSFTFEYDKDKMTISKDSTHIYVIPKTFGNLSFKLILDDGVERIEQIYNIISEKNSNVDSDVSNNLSSIVTKIMGHMGVFAILSLFTLNMFRYFHFNSKINKFIAYTFCGAFFGCLTEFIQLFYPNRNGAIKDVFIDLTGFYIGTIIFLFLYRHLKKKRDKMKQKEEMIKLNAIV